MEDDFEFEFFDDQDTGEISASRVDPDRSGPEPPSSDHARRRRIAVPVVVSLIVVIVIVVVLTQGSGSRAAAYRDYLRQLSPIASDSQQTGQAVGVLLSSVRSGRTNDPLPQLGQLAGQARNELARAERLRPPAGLLSEQQQALISLGFRLSGLQGLHTALGQALGSTRSTGETAIAAQIARLTTSDVIWADRVWQPLDTAVRRLAITDTAAPRSQFVADLNASSPDSINALLHPRANTGTTIKLGSTGPAVARWQEQLDRWLQLTHQALVTADGAFGAATVAATQALQRSRGLAPDGIVGPRTRSALGAALASGAGSG